jgi:predicted RNA methylase
MAARSTFKISDEVRDVLSRSTITETSVKLPDGQLERKLYEAVNPREALGLAVATGKAVNLQTKFQAFYTPTALADRVAAAANLKRGQRVLEPSVGGGALVLAAAKVAAVRVDAFDIDPSVAAKIEVVRGAAANAGTLILVQVGDFLEVVPDPIYDAVLMNPPFQKEQDMQHVAHAWEFVKPGGSLVAVMGAGPSGWRESRSKRAVAFRALVSAAASNEVVEVPRGTFEDTDVATVMLILHKQGD